MTQKPHYTLIGAFVVGSLAIVVTALLFFGSGKFFEQTKTFVVYFKDSVKGLSVGASVNFRGAKVGTVSNIELVYNPKDDSLRIPVLIEIDPSSIKGLEVIDSGSDQDAPLMERLIARGMRAQLAMDSIVTGQLYVRLDFMTDDPPIYYAKESKYPEIPTEISSIDQIRSKLEKIPIESIAEGLHSALTSIDKLLKSDDIQKILTGINDLVADADLFVKTVNSRIVPMADQGDAFLNSATGTFDELQLWLEPTSPMASKLLVALDELADAARSIKLLADYLERHPEALIKGKG